MRILPTRRFLLLLGWPVAVLLALPSWPVVAAVIVYDVGLLLVAVVDLWRSPKDDDLPLRRLLPEHLSLGAMNAVGWQLDNKSRVAVGFEITEDVPSSFEKSDESLRGVILPESTARLVYHVRPTRRGLYTFGDIHLRTTSLLGLSQRQRVVRKTHSTKVYPNVQSLAQVELAAQRHRLAELGLRPVRSTGHGRAFESLRDYVPGDDMSDIAWKATARRGRFITRTYEPERSQTVLMVLDCGRLMTTEVDAMSRLDHAVNMTILMTYVAMKQGDYVGLLAFSDRIESYVPPTRGRAALRRMNEALYRLEPRMRESDYAGACRFLSLRHRKRSLIIMVTDVLGPDASAALLSYTAQFAKHHLPLCVTLRNRELERMASASPDDAARTFTKAVTLDLVAERKQALRRMQRAGVSVLDVDVRELGPRLISRYVELKQRHAW